MNHIFWPFEIHLHGPDSHVWPLCSKLKIGPSYKTDLLAVHYPKLAAERPDGMTFTPLETCDGSIIQYIGAPEYTAGWSIELPSKIHNEFFIGPERTS